MTRPGPSRLPGDPRSGDREFGALGGLVDDVFFWEADIERSRELEMRRFEADCAASARPRHGASQRPGCRGRGHDSSPRRQGALAGNGQHHADGGAGAGANLRRRAPRREKLTHGARPVGLRELPAVGPADQRMVQKPGRRPAAQEAAEADLGRRRPTRSSPRITRPTPWRRSSTTTQKA